MNGEDRLLFLRYALPCASTLVRRGNVTQDHVSNLTKMVSQNKIPPEGSESMFVVANAMCDKIAKRMGKSQVDSEVIRTYFLLEHSEVVDDRFKLMKDFNPVDCKTYPGKVISTGSQTAVVETSLGRKDCKMIFAPDVKEGDDVVVHYDYIIERITSETAQKMSQPKAR